MNTLTPTHLVYRTACAAACLLLAVWTGPVAAEITWHGSAAATSDYVHRGVSQSSGQPALQLGVSAQHHAGYYAALWGSTIDTTEQAPDFGDGNGFEADILVGLTRSMGSRWRWDVNLGRYIYFDENRILHYNYYELNAALAWRDRLMVSAAWTPQATDHARSDAPLSGDRWVLELAGEFPLGAAVSATAGLGYVDLSRVSDVRHSYWSAGVNVRLGRYLVALTRFGTDSDARERFFDGRADGRLALTVAMTFGGR